jgi:hypothetical protein
VAWGEGLLEVGDSEADVMPDRFHILVAEEFLDDPGAGAAAEEVVDA